MSGSRLTIELDEATAGTLRELTDLWGIPPHEAVVRAVKTAAMTMARPSRSEDCVAVFRQLQTASEMTPEKAARWKDSARAGRR
jgi:hypothetical protein